MSCGECPLQTLTVSQRLLGLCAGESNNRRRRGHRSITIISTDAKICVHEMGRDGRGGRQRIGGCPVNADESEIGAPCPFLRGLLIGLVVCEYAAHTPAP